MTGAFGRVRRLVAGFAVAGFLGCGLSGLLGAQGQEKPAAKALAKLTEPWPDDKALARRRADAENLPLFRDDAPLAIRITADFKAINRDRQPDSEKRFPGVLEVEGDAGANVSIPIRLGSRGHARLNRRTCSVVPLRLEFEKEDVKGTVFDGQRELKLVTHCNDGGDHEQYVLTEYLAYRLYRLLTPRSFRARLVRATYVESGGKNPPAPKYGMLLERDNDVASRLETREYDLPHRTFQMLDQESLTLMALLQYMIGNTDCSIYALHNIKLLQDKAGKVYPVAYDFDYSGLVNAWYAVTDPQLKLGSVRNRLYRGPCRTLPELEPFLAAFASKKAEMLALVDAVPDLKASRRNDTRRYLGEFFDIVENPRQAKRVLVDGCTRAVTM